MQETNVVEISIIQSRQFHMNEHIMPPLQLPPPPPPLPPPPILLPLCFFFVIVHPSFQGKPATVREVEKY